MQGMLSVVKLADKRRWQRVLAASTTPRLAVRKSSDLQAVDCENFDGALSVRASLLRKSSDVTLAKPHSAFETTSRSDVSSGEVQESCVCRLRNSEDLVRYIGGYSYDVRKVAHEVDVHVINDSSRTGENTSLHFFAFFLWDTR